MCFFSDSLCCLVWGRRTKESLWGSGLESCQYMFFCSLKGVSVCVCVVWRGEREGCAIINIRSCRETKGLKWKGLAGRGDLAMSCTSVIFLLRLELSQGFNWNPDFKEALAPRSTRPSSAFLQPSPLTPSTARCRMDAGMDTLHLRLRWL